MTMAHDKKKFDSLIGEVAFYVDGLEKLSDRLNVLDLPQQLLRLKIQEVTNIDSIALLEAASTRSDTLSSSPALNAENSTTISGSTRGHTYIGTVIKDRARVLNGNLGIQGPSLSTHRFEGTQTSNEAYVVQGDMSLEAAMAFFK